MRLFDLRTMTRRELLAGVIGSAAFLLIQWAVVGLLPAQVFMVLLFNVLYLAHPVSRRLAVALLPFVVFEICYDWMRLYPNYKVNPIDIYELYATELSLLGVSS